MEDAHPLDIYKGCKLIRAQEGPQRWFEKSKAFEILIGGAAGGGKSFELHKYPLKYRKFSNFKSIIFRKTTSELLVLKDYSYKIIPKIEPRAKPVRSGECLTWHFPCYCGKCKPGEHQGSRYMYWHMNGPEDYRKHDGDAYTMVLFDELQSFTEEEYTHLFSRCRTDDPELKGVGKVLSSAMPEGRHCGWVNRRFIQLGPYKIHQVKTVIDGRELITTRQFIPARLEDNPILTNSTPDYEARLALSGEEKFRRLRYGDWSNPKGAYFSELSKQTHGATPHRPPEGTYCWVAMDWGSAKPYSVGWYYERASDGAIIRFQELYGGVPGQDTGYDHPIKYVAQRIKEMSEGLYIAYYMGDPSIWSGEADDIETVGEKFQLYGIYWQKANNERIQGWRNFKERVSTFGGRKPTFFCTIDCEAFWSLMPTLPHDKNRWEDLDTKSEDHIADETRYSCQSRRTESADMTKVKFGSPSVMARGC
jgi:hypothetical protein